MPSRVVDVLRRFATVFGSAAVTLVWSASVVPGAHADTFNVTYLPPGIDAANTGIAGADALCAQASACVLGIQTFNAPSLTSGATFPTDFGTSGRITGTYSGAFQIVPSDTYGGASGDGQYVSVPNLGSYTISLATSGVPGVNFFGLWISALDSGNTLTFYNHGAQVFTFVPDVLMADLGTCDPTLLAAHGYCGNPNPPFDSVADSPTQGQTALDGFQSNQDFNPQQYVFVDFFDPNGFFDTIVASEQVPGNFESDNQTIGYRDPNLAVGTPVNEPPAAALLLAGLAAIAIAARRAKRTRRAAA